MILAMIVDSHVANLIEIDQSQLDEFAGYIPANGRPINIGDKYVDGCFYRDGKLVQTEDQRNQGKVQAISTAALATAKDMCSQANVAPNANVGLFVAGAEDWEAGKAYERFDLFRYNGAVGWVKQAHTSQETWLPFSAGTEALYGARPVPDDSGVYPYVYNMKVEVGMKVYDDGVVYECIQGTDELLYKPAQVPALFRVM